MRLTSHLLLFAILCTSALLHGDALAEAPSNSKTWACPDFGFSVQTPTDWEERAKNDPRLALLLTEGKATVEKLGTALAISVVQEKAADHAFSLDDQAEQLKNVSRKHHPDVEFGPVETVMIDGSEGRVFSMTYTSDKRSARSARMLTVHADKAYVFGYTCDRSAGEDFRKPFEAIMATFHWVEAK